MGLAKAGYKVAAIMPAMTNAPRPSATRPASRRSNGTSRPLDDCKAGMGRSPPTGSGGSDRHNARHHPRRHMKKMSRTAWDEVLDTNLGGCYNMSKVAWDGMLERGFAASSISARSTARPANMARSITAAGQSGIHGFTKALAQEGRRQGHHRQRHRAGLYRHRHGAGRARPCAGKDRRADSGGTAGQGRGDCARGAVFGCRRWWVHHRVNAVHQRRTTYVLSAWRGVGLLAVVSSSRVLTGYTPARRTLLLTLQNPSRLGLWT